MQPTFQAHATRNSSDEYWHVESRARAELANGEISSLTTYNLHLCSDGVVHHGKLLATNDEGKSPVNITLDPISQRVLIERGKKTLTWCVPGE